MQDTIDFIIPWVDGADPNWQKLKRKYSGKETTNENQDCRYRDWEILKYWFRSIEKNAPWFRKIHFVTCGQIPDFLNVDHPKLNLVNHTDYIPEKYLPTFSSHVIELNFHRLHDLAEQFVYFNDDMFINRPMSERDFFQEGKPRYRYLESPFIPHSPISPIFYYSLNSIGVVNNHFSGRKNRRQEGFKKLSPKNGKAIAGNLLMLPWSGYSAFHTDHMAVPLLKSTLNEIWEKEFDLLDQTSSHKFRELTDINQYVIRYWDMARGNFVPGKNSCGFYDINSGNIDACIMAIQNAQYSLICINDSAASDNFEILKSKLVQAFERRYPEKCSFEK